MTAALDKLTRPSVDDYKIDTGHKKLGLGVGAIGLLIGMVVAGIGIYAAYLVGQGGQEDTVARWLAVGFGLNTLGLATLKTAIAIVLVGILVRLWLRVGSIKASLPALRTDASDHPVKTGDIDTRHRLPCRGIKVPGDKAAPYVHGAVVDCQRR